MVQRWAMIENGVVVNVCSWDGDITRWQPPVGVIMILAPDNVGMAWRYDNGEWLPPIPTPEPDQIEG